MELLKIVELKKNFKENRAVDGIDFCVYEDEIFGLLGPNGAGKSTVISMICGLVKPSAGEFYLKGKKVDKDHNDIKRILGFVPQDIALYPLLTARENLKFWGRMYGLWGKTLDNRVDEALEYVGLTDRAGDKIDTYSGGMKRRANIAAALLHHPKLLIMDEPTVGIDPQSRNHILEAVHRLNSEGVTVIYTSHYMEEIEYLCHRLAIMDHGKIIAMGTKDKVKEMVEDVDLIGIELSNINTLEIDDFKNIDYIRNVDVSSDILNIRTKNASENLPIILDILSKQGCRVKNIKIQEPNLETVFLELTGRALRD